MFDFIKKLFSPIAAFIGGLFGGKKSQGDKSSKADTSAALKTKKAKGYYLELDEGDNTKSAAPAKKPEPAKVESGANAKKPEPAKVESGANAKKPEPAKAEVATLERPKVGESNPVAEVPSANGKVKVEAQPNLPAPALNGKVEAQAENTFAPKYLIPTGSSGRRRPGPSLDTFRDMARQVKTPG